MHKVRCLLQVPGIRCLWRGLNFYLRTKKPVSALSLLQERLDRQREALTGAACTTFRVFRFIRMSSFRLSVIG